jgi:UDP-N-acetylmuramyl tripeptide synthase
MKWRFLSFLPFAAFKKIHFNGNEEQNMRKFTAILVCKLLRLVGKLAGKGSSMPGKIALRIDPNILRKLKLPEYVIAVTGSNGKTSTVEMMAHILRQNGYRVAYNKEGSNQIEGVTTFLLGDSTFSGKVKSDIVLIESDERFARHTFKHFIPTHYVITNLYRDQLTRNGHPEWVYRIISQSIHDGSRLILNADDPLVSCFGYGKDDVVWFGVERFSESTDENTSVYNDGKYCPHCKQPMNYEYYHYNHIGKYECPSCGHKRHDPQFAVTEVNLSEGYIVVDGAYRISLALKSIYNVYNLLAAYSVCRLVGIDGEKIAADISSYVLKNGRVVTFDIGEHKGTLLTSKHENSISYDQSMRVARAYPEDTTVMIIVDAVSRKYFTSETSWLWDIDFELLEHENIKKVILAGTYCHDLAVRFSYTNIPQEQIEIYSDISQAVQAVKDHGIGYLYVITCFSDKDKFLNLVQVHEPGEETGKDR